MAVALFRGDLAVDAGSCAGVSERLSAKVGGPFCFADPATSLEQEIVLHYPHPDTVEGEGQAPSSLGYSRHNKRPRWCCRNVLRVSRIQHGKYHFVTQSSQHAAIAVLSDFGYITRTQNNHDMHVVVVFSCRGNWTFSCRNFDSFCFCCGAIFQPTGMSGSAGNSGLSAAVSALSISVPPMVPTGSVFSTAMGRPSKILTHH
jgi:hypothetical protein